MTKVKKQSHAPAYIKPFTALVKRFHMTLFIVFITACLGYAVSLFTTFLNQASTDSGYTSPISAGTIDQTTLDRIKALHTSSEATAPTQLPAGRTDPFTE